LRIEDTHRFDTLDVCHVLIHPIALVWDTSGLVLIWKQLQQGSFRWPPIMDGVMKLSPVEFGLTDSQIEVTEGVVPQIPDRIEDGLCVMEEIIPTCLNIDTRPVAMSD
jgi:hypothetical protein